ncbi:hypothetical protein HMPREF1210_01004 [Paenisporosarcina sp. HGH0030]|uniref:hypothetical protein n=1 Tax=Paenisporosarcina sp. HGH0030 TaxID=1078085 RepID=UPI00034E4414|nr:hypothetical protein [Paenisporosarcina sp. HGH0030]EPD53273.1 hypothetical protein HMPREF1210_01004 [Paenisporosarcina sp. HGH0030]
MSIKFKYRIALIILMIIFISFQAMRIIDSYNKGFLSGLPSFQLLIGLIILIALFLPNHQKEDE